MNAQEADKKAVDSKFLLELDEHSFSDLQGTAPRHISLRLREPDMIEHFRDCLISLQAKYPSGTPIAKAIYGRLMEANAISKRYMAEGKVGNIQARSMNKYLNSMLHVAGALYIEHLKANTRGKAMRMAIEDTRSIYASLSNGVEE